MCQGLGWAIGPAAAGYLFDTVGFGGTFTALAAMVALSWILMMVVGTAVKDAQHTEAPACVRMLNVERPHLHVCVWVLS